MGYKGPVLRPRCIRPGRSRTQIPFNWMMCVTFSAVMRYRWRILTEDLNTRRRLAKFCSMSERKDLQSQAKEGINVPPRVVNWVCDFGPKAMIQWRLKPLRRRCWPTSRNGGYKDAYSTGRRGGTGLWIAGGTDLGGVSNEVEPTVVMLP
jgi:hypothetical protein